MRPGEWAAAIVACVCTLVAAAALMAALFEMSGPTCPKGRAPQFTHYERVQHAKGNVSHYPRYICVKEGQS